MRVKRLEVEGFKSFKDKTIINFDNDITGIVGPNGCGKSNIVDAFFWVMGEQSYKHMRGSGSSDLIFNGSSKYTPLGLAEATIVFETDYVETDEQDEGLLKNIPIHLRSKEVAITRKVYRDGQGEYFINGIQCRLKDIHEFFMDTGVGAKGYSIIEQGQIGKIVNSKPDERRLLVEEAAGIAKYKARRKESMRKMEATQANLERLQDVVSEIERQLNSLERQAQKAIKYKEYKDELFEKEVTWGRRKNKVLIAQIDELKQERSEIEQEIDSLRSRLQVSENEIEVDQVQQVTDTKDAEALQEEIQTQSDRLTYEQSALELSRRRQEDLSKQVESMERERTELVQTLEQDQTRLNSLQEQLAHASEAVQGMADEVEKQEAAVRELRSEEKAFRTQLESDRAKVLEGMTKASDLNSEVAALSARIESFQSQADGTVDAETELSLKIENYRENLQKRSEQVSEQTRLRDEARLEQERKSEQRTEVLSRLKEDRQKKYEIETTLTQTQTKLEGLEELAAAYEGLGSGAKSLLDWAKESDRGNLSVLADLYDVKEGYERSIEGWLESKLEYIIAEDFETALEGVHYLQKTNGGRAAIHFANKENSKSESTADRERQAEIAASAQMQAESSGFVVRGRLVDFVQLNKEKLFEYENRVQIAELSRGLLSRALVVESFDDQNVKNWIKAEGFQRSGYEALISLDGSVLENTGVLRGGFGEGDESASLLSRRNAIENLKSEIIRHQEALTETSLHVETLSHEESRLEQEIKDADARRQSLEIDLTKVTRDQEQEERNLADAEEQRDALKLKRESLLSEVRQARENREKLEQEMNEIISLRSEIESRLSDDDRKLESLNAEIKSREEQLNALRVEEASLREKSVSAEREVSSLDSVRADRQKRLDEIQVLLEQVSREREQHTGDDSGIENRISEITHALGQSKEKLSLIKDRLEQCGSRLNENLEKIKKIHSDVDQKSTRANAIAVELEKNSGELNHLIQNLEDKYGKDCLDQSPSVPIQEEMEEPVVTQEMTEEEERVLFEEVERLRERIRRLGEVNTMAIEEYEELKERYDHLCTERGDLEDSIQNLQEAIEHINKTSKERFRKAFESISTRFERLFPIVFGGGSAQLKLVYDEDSTDILEAGIDIFASPPGKKVSNISLLSGGEKALTAVCMIFAIFMVKPSPFCLLDEVDAPLDDANIGKFNALLKEMSNNSQFIIITHNKKTMELNDSLYGVTMEEPGVSKLVSIALH